jgi:PPM family protein phosphatase
MSITSIGRESNTGNKRRRNEDSFVVAPPLFAVADGMGGAQAGEVASKLAAAALEDTDPGSTGGVERVVELIQEANRRVYERSNADPSASGMGTTITAALVEGTSVTFGHVGDSRAYLVRDGVIEQLTEDHSLVNELMKSGKLSAEEAETHPQRSVITRALGTDPDVDVDTFAVDAQAGDVFLICSDGLSSMVSANDIEEILRKYRSDLVAASKALIQAANRGGGEDNITAVLFAVEDGDAGGGTAPPDEHTREFAFVPEEEDTLHPEDGVAPPPSAPSAVDTMVVPAADIQAAVAARTAVEDTAQEAPQAGIGRRFLALVVILALIAVIVVLVWWGLAR